MTRTPPIINATHPPARMVLRKLQKAIPTMLPPLRMAIRPMERSVSKPDSFVGELTKNDLLQEQLKIRDGIDAWRALRYA
jgi:hypothetical protein